MQSSSWMEQSTPVYLVPAQLQPMSLDVSIQVPCRHGFALAHVSGVMTVVAITLLVVKLLGVGSVEEDEIKVGAVVGMLLVLVGGPVAIVVDAVVVGTPKYNV